jgi:hypothetical protein
VISDLGREAATALAVSHARARSVSAPIAPLGDNTVQSSAFRDPRPGSTSMHRLICIALLCLAAATFSGCIVVGGSSKHESPTLGKQLTDLKDALDKGAIGPAEYEQAKGKLLTN